MLLAARPGSCRHMKQNQKSFSPKLFDHTGLARWLMQIEAVRRSVDALPITHGLASPDFAALLDTLLDGD